MKTVLLIIFHGAAAKNILRTGVVEAILKDRHVRVVCGMRFKDRALSYSEEIPHVRMVYDSFYLVPKCAFERVFSFLKYRLIRTATTDLRHKMSYDSHKNYVRYLAATILNRIIARRSVRPFLRYFDYHLIKDPGYGIILERHKPDVVFFTQLFDDGEISLLREAKKRSIPTVGFINSWDKLTARCSLRLLPDTLIVFNDIIKKDAMEHADMPENRIAVCGMPQYDQYVMDTPMPRKDFFMENGLDFQKRLILYAPMGVTFSDSDWNIIDLLHDIFSSGEIRKAQLIVRFPPNDFLDERALAQRPWLKYEIPGIRFGKERSVDWDMDFDQLKHLTDLLAHTSILISHTSSIAVDAAIFDKPIIGINFKTKDNLPLSKVPIAHYDTDHFSKVCRTGAIRLVSDRQELVSAINAYLLDPSLDRKERKVLVHEQCGVLDGKAGERVAHVVLKTFKTKD